MSDDSLDKLMYSFVLEDVLGGFFISVPPGYVACVYDRGQGVLKNVWLPGLHLKIPFWQKAKLFNTQTLEYTISRDIVLDNQQALGDVPIKAMTKDNKHSLIEGTMLLRLDVSQIPVIWQNIGEDFVPKIVRPTIRSRVRMIASRFTFQEISSLQRDRVESEIKDELERILRSRGIIIENVLLSEIQETRGDDM